MLLKYLKKQENTIAEKQAKKFDLYEAAGLAGIQLLYGTKYDFRVRLADISGGGPELEDHRKYAAPSPEGFCDFRRRVQPQAVRLQNELPKEDGVYFIGRYVDNETAFARLSICVIHWPVPKCGC